MGMAAGGPGPRCLLRTPLWLICMLAVRARRGGPAQHRAPPARRAPDRAHRGRARAVAHDDAVARGRAMEIAGAHRTRHRRGRRGPAERSRRRLAADGAHVVVTDLDPRGELVAQELGGRFVRRRHHRPVTSALFAGVDYPRQQRRRRPRPTAASRRLIPPEVLGRLSLTFNLRCADARDPALALARKARPSIVNIASSAGYEDTSRTRSPGIRRGQGRADPLHGGARRTRELRRARLDPHRASAAGAARDDGRRARADPDPDGRGRRRGHPLHHRRRPRGPRHRSRGWRAAAIVTAESLIG